MPREKKLRPAAIVTWLFALAIGGGLLNLALDDEVAAVALPEPSPPAAKGAGAVEGPDPAELAPRFEAALSKRSDR